MADKTHRKTEEAMRLVRAGTHTRYAAAKAVGIHVRTIYRYDKEDLMPTLPKSFKHDPPQSEQIEPKKPRWSVKTS